MKVTLVFIIFILMVHTTTSSSGRKINNIITKFHHRRAAGILAQPRVGRTINMAAFSGLDGSTGLVHYPRVGKFDSTFYPNFIKTDHVQLVDQQRNIREHFNARSFMNFMYRG